MCGFDSHSGYKKKLQEIGAFLFYVSFTMAYNEILSDRIREALVNLPDVYEKHMFGGVCYMVNDKMCIGVVKDELMCRIHPDREEEALLRYGARPMNFTGRAMKGYVFVGQEGLTNEVDFHYWIQLCLEFNPLATASKKKTKKKI